MPKLVMTPRSASCFGFAPHGIGIGIASMSWRRARAGVAVAALRLAALERPCAALGPRHRLAQIHRRYSGLALLL